MNAFMRLVTEMKANAEIQEFNEAIGLVIVEYDPETDRTTIIGPFPKGTTEAVEAAQKAQDAWEALGDLPNVVYKVLPLLSPECLKSK